MSWETFDYVLLRGFLPLILLGSTLTRYNGFSFVYLLMLLICPLLRYNMVQNIKHSVHIYLIVLITLSGMFAMSIPIMHITMLIDATLLKNCSYTLTTVSHQIGIIDLNDVKYYRVLRLVLPDYIVLITGIVLLIYFRKRAVPKSGFEIENVGPNDDNRNNDLTNIIPDSEVDTPDSMSAGPSKQTVVPKENTPTFTSNPNPIPLQGINPNHHTCKRQYEGYNYLHETFGIDRLRKKFWRAWAMQSLFVFFNVVVTGFAGIISPSILNAVYLFGFLGICTFWALGNKVITTNFAYMRIFLLMYSAIHLCLLYLVQIESMQYFLPNGQFSSRLLGLYYLVDSSCLKRGEFIFQQQRWIDYLSPSTILYVYYFCATETRRWFEKGRESVPRVRSYKEDTKLTSIKQQNTHDPELQRHLITDKETVSRAGSTLTTIASRIPDYPLTTNCIPMVQMKGANVAPRAGEDSPEDIDDLSSIVVQNQGDVIDSALPQLNLTERPLLLSVINTSIRNSFVFTFIAMMSWSVTYKSWMSFILLLSACILWMMPDSRRACLYMSPLIVFYATCLIVIQYIYGFNLDELPEVTYTKSGTKVDLAEIGLHKWSIPAGPLAVMIGFLVIFWLTLRLFMNERLSQIHKSTEPVKQSTFDEESNADSEAYFGNVDNVIYRKIISFLNGICEKYWILVCCFAMLFVSVQGPVVVFRIVYMFMLLYFLMTFMCSYSFWRKQMYVFWWFVIVYSVIVLLCIYTFQFQQFPYLWKNKTGLSEDILRDIGLQTYNSAALFQGLLTPVVFLVVIIVQVRYFHKPFLRLSSMNRFQYMDNRQPGANQANLETSPSTTSTSASAFIEDVNSAFQIIVEKLKQFFEVIYTNVWRFFECHFTKIVVFSIMYGCINEVNACNVVLVLVMVIGFPFTRLHSMVVTVSFLWCALIVLMKMIYQLKTVHKFNWPTNCSAFNNDFNKSMDQIDNAKWIGLMKVEDFQHHIWPWTAVLVVCGLWHAMKYHQKQYYNSRDSERPLKGIVFPEISAKTIDDSLINLIKFAFNFTFYKLGLEFCHIVTVIVACLRVDLFSVVYLTLLLIFLCTPRKVCSKLWLPYLFFLGTLLPIQYSFCVGLPPGLCLKYPMNISASLQQWLFLPSYTGPPVAKKLMADFFQFIFVALQYQVFKIENSPEVDIYGGGRNRPIMNNELPKTIDKDFVSTKDSYVDYLKHAVFYWSYWLSLAIVFTTGVFWITLFCLGYMILAFIYLWMGQNIMLRKRSNLIASWNVIIYYNFFVILSKCTLQLMGCVYMETMLSQSLCWIIQLFGVQCIDPMSWNILTNKNSAPSQDPLCISENSGLHWDVTCFLFIILQRKIFMTKSFCHVVLDLNVQNRFASRGAYLINKKMMATIREQKLKEERVLQKIQEKINKITLRQAQHGKPELNEHYLVVRSGDYYLFEGDPEEDDDCVLNFDDGEVRSKKVYASTDDTITQLNGTSMMNKSGSESNSEGTITNESITGVSKTSTLPVKFGLNTIKESSNLSLDQSRKGSEGGNKIATDKKEDDKIKDKETEFSDSSEEDDANPSQTQNILLNPLQLINRAMEQGPRSAVREFKRTQSECRENAQTNRRCSVHMGSRLESMSEQDELNSLPDAYNTPPPQASGSTTEDSFYSATIQHDIVGPPEQCNNACEESKFQISPNNEAVSPSLYRDANSSTEQLDLDGLDKRGTEKSSHADSCWSKFKASILVFYYFIQSTADSVIVLINGWTREYRRIGRTLDNEKLLVKRKVISKISNEVDCRIQLEEIVLEIVGNKSHSIGPSKNPEECLREQEFRRSRSRFFLLAIAIGNFAIIYSEFVCYFLLILNHMLSGNLFSLPYPLMVFLWAMLSVPRPSKNFWIALITYTEIVIVIKYIFQFHFIQFNAKHANQFESLWMPRIIGIEKSENYAVFDMIQLLFIFLHRGYLKNTGSWRDHVELAQDLDMVDKEQSIKDKYQSSYDDSNLMLSRSSCNPLNKMRRFYAKMTNPKFNKKVDVYVYMFLCEFIAFLIIIFGYVSFGPGTDSADNAFDFIKTNKIPVPFIIMIITQFVFIIIDRALFLRKQVKGKFIFQVFHVLLIHAWLFFILPHITKKPFNSQVAPQLLYFVKCIYFALSAYQMKSGYPLRILGNFLTRNFNYVNLFLFKGYMVVPFLYELRNVMDWMWTDTAVALYHWMEVEDVFCKIFVLKCWRRSELEYPTQRGRTRRLASKYSVGGLLLAFFFICFWGPLTLSSFIGTTFVGNAPVDCSITIGIGGFSPLYVFNARGDHLKSTRQETFDNIKACYINEMPATNYLQSFEVPDVTELRIVQVSGDIWAINPPGLSNLKKRLKSNESLSVNMKTICERRTIENSKSTEKFVSYTHSKKLTRKEKDSIFNAINGSSNFSLYGVFPRYLTAYKRTLSVAKVLVKKIHYINLDLIMRNESSVTWWELRENGYSNTFCPNASSQKAKLKHSMIFVFSERVSDNLFGHLFSNYGILGMYAAYIFVAHRVLRAFYSDISYIIRLEELPHVDRILNLLNEIYLVRENKMFHLEEQLIAKLIFLYRSSETIIKWTRHKKSNLEKHMEKPNIPNHDIDVSDLNMAENISISRKEDNQA